MRMRKVFSYFSATISLALTLAFISLSAAAIADTLGWRFNAAGIASDLKTPAITQAQDPGAEQKRC
jgi:hypothetical protein